MTDMRALVDAMDRADDDGLIIPCGQRPDLWTSKKLERGTRNSRCLALVLAHTCRTICPVFDTCRRLVVERSGEGLYGVVAGYHISFAAESCYREYAMVEIPAWPTEVAV